MSKWLSGILIMTLLAGCAVPGAIAMEVPTEIREIQAQILTPSPTPTLAATGTLTRTATAEPTPTITSTPTPHATATEPPPLNPVGPYLFTGYRLLNPDGSGEKALPWLDDLNPFRISPDAEWNLVYSSDEFGYGQEEVLSLSLIHIPDGEIVPLADIATRTILTRDYSYLTGECGGHYYSLLYHFAWSPDGRYLAFVANTSGKGLDLFSYDMDRRILRRLTNQTAEVLWFAWSPDSRIIYYVNGHQMQDNFTFQLFTLSATRPENGPNQGIRALFTTPEEIAIESIGANYDLLISTVKNEGCMAGGRPDLERKIVSIDYDSQSAQDFLPSPTAVLLDVHPAHSLALVGLPAVTPDKPSRNTILKFDGRLFATLGVETGACRELYFLGNHQDAFLCRDGNGGLSVISPGRETRAVDIGGMQEYQIEPSPDREHFLLYAEWESRLYSAEGRFIAERKFEEPKNDRSYDLVTGIVWRPDEVYVALGNRRIEFLSFADGTVMTVYACPESSLCVWGLTWADWD